MVTRPIQVQGAARRPLWWLRALRALQVRKMWLVMFVSAILVLAQYRVSSSWLSVLRLPPAGVGLDSNDISSSSGGGGVGGGGPEASEPTPWPGVPGGPGVPGVPGVGPGQGVTLGSLERAVRLSVQRLAENNAMAAHLGAHLLREVADQLQMQVSPPPTCAPVLQLPGLAPPSPHLPPLYVVTPTYRRPEQMAELTRLGQTLLLVRNVRWIVVEDAEHRSKQVEQLLRKLALPYDHLTAPMPEEFRKKRGAKPKGVAQRNRGLRWLRANATEGVFYFADDDNTYDVAIFEEIRTTKRVSMFPVGLCTKYGLSTPIVARNGSFLGFYDGWVGGRKFPVDMAGFAVSVKFLRQRPRAMMPFSAGFEEDGFLRSLAPLEAKEIELKADNCTKVLVWHTQTKPNAPSLPLDAKYSNTNLSVLKTLIV